MDDVYAFRSAVASDHSALFELYRSVMGDYIDRIWGWDSQWQQDDFSTHFDPDLVTVVVSAGQVVGYMHVEPGERELYIRMLLLAPEHQRKGLGTRLLQQVIAGAFAQGVGVKLQVFRINRLAKRFYERHGFDVIRETPVSFEMWLDAGLIR